MVKQAEEEEFAGRIMARGFADELNKLAAPEGKVSIGGPANAGREAARQRGANVAKSMFSGVGNIAAGLGGGASKPAPAPRPTLGSVVGKLNVSKDMPAVPGQPKKQQQQQQPTMVAKAK